VLSHGSNNYIHFDLVTLIIKLCKLEDINFKTIQLFKILENSITVSILENSRSYAIFPICN